MAEKKVIELEVKTESVGNLKAELRKAQAEVTMLAEKFGATSQEAIQAAKKAAELKDAIADAKALTDAYNPDAKFNALASSIGGVLNGFQAFEGALGLVGVESENVQKALLQVQSAMALTQGINGVLEAKEDFARLGKQISDVYSDAIKGFKGMTAAGKAFAVTGIGLLITGLGLVISYWDDIKKAIGGVTTAQEDLNSTLDAYKEGATEAIKQTTEVGNAFDLARQGVISKDEALHLYNETLGDSFGKAKNLNEAEKLYADKTDAYIKATALRAQAQALFAKAAEEQVKALTANLEDQTSFAGKASAGLTGYFFGLKEGVNEYTKAQKEGEKQTKKVAEARANQLNDLAASLLKEAELVENKNKIISKNEKATQDAIKEANKAALEKAKERWEKDKEYGEKRIALGEKILKDLAALEENRKNKEAKIIAQSSTTKEELYKREAERINKLREDEFKDAKGFLEAEITANQYNFQARYDLLELQRQKELENKELTEGEITAIEAKYAQQRKEISKDEKAYKQQTNDFIFESTKQTLDLISGITEIFGKKGEREAKKAFQIQKAVSIAQATIDTYKSANAIFAAAAANPATVLFPAQPFIAAGLAVAAGLVNVAKIASQKFEGGGASGSSAPSSAGNMGSSGTSSVISPNFNIVGNAQATNPLAGLGNQPIQAYVVSGEVTTAQNLDRNRINYATFG